MMVAQWDPPQIPKPLETSKARYTSRRSKSAFPSARKLLEQIGFSIYIALFLLAPLVGWQVGELVSPLVPNPTYDPTVNSKVVENCYLSYDSPRGPYETCDYSESNPKLVRKYGNPELYMFLMFWGAVFSLPPLKREFLRSVWNRRSK